jgi:hypothetical protein
MRAQRRQQTTTVIAVLALLLGSLWAGALAAGAGNPADQLTAAHAKLGVGAAALPDRGPALRPSAERPDPGGRLLPLLGGLLAAALAATSGPRARRARPSPAAAGPLAWPSQREARAPPFLQPA